MNKSFVLNHKIRRKPPICLFTNLPAYLPTTCLPTYVPTYLPTFFFFFLMGVGEQAP